MTFTENGATAYASSNNSLVDLFYSSVRGMTEETLSPLFAKSISEFPNERKSVV